MRILQRESVVKDRYIKGFVGLHFDSQDLPNTTEGTEKLVKVFSSWLLGMVDYADGTQDFEIYLILQTLNCGDIIACADRGISNIRKNPEVNSTGSKSVAYWSQIRDYAIMAQLQEDQRESDQL